MHDTLRPRPAFTLAEIVVALVLLGVGAAGLAGGIIGHGRLSDLASQHAFAAERVRAHLELLAARRCTADTADTAVERWGVEAWRAVAGTGAWTLTDSLALRRVAHPLVIEARVACPE
jgi:prepilin-type N-terminal cleavage/methylation domain-containing protein